MPHENRELLVAIITASIISKQNIEAIAPYGIERIVSTAWDIVDTIFDEEEKRTFIASKQSNQQQATPHL